MKTRDLNNLIMLTVGVLGSVLIILELNNTGLGSVSWETVSQEISVLAVAVMFIGLVAYMITRRR